MYHKMMVGLSYVFVNNRFPYLTHTQEFYRAQILNRSMSRARCDRVSENLHNAAPFVQRVEFIEALAALTSMFEEEVATCSGSV
jgi:hypothetical protein